MGLYSVFSHRSLICTFCDRGTTPTKIISLPSILQQDKKEAAALLQLLHTYCNTGIAWEYMHVATQAKQDFLPERQPRGLQRDRLTDDNFLLLPKTCHNGRLGCDAW